jgi:drug/metabolite transporter (DMT)-like permease
MTRRGLLLFLALGLIWGLPYLLIRVAVRDVSPALLVFVRTAGGALLLSPFVARRGDIRALLALWKPLLAYSAVEIAVPWWFLATAETKVPSSLAGLLVSAVPIAGAVIARIKGTDRLDARRLAGLGLGMGGVAALVGFDLRGSSLLAASSFLIVVTGYALGPWLFSRYLTGPPAVSVVTASLVICAVAYAPIAGLELPTRPLSAEVALSLAGLTTICTALAFICFFALIREVGPMRATVITYLNPAVAVVLGVAVLGEHFGPVAGVGFFAVLGGSFLATRPLRTAPPVEIGSFPTPGIVGPD